MQDSRRGKTVYLCEECGRIHSSKQQLEGDVCESLMQPGHLARRKKLISDFELCGEMGDREVVLTALRKAHSKSCNTRSGTREATEEGHNRRRCKKSTVAEVQTTRSEESSTQQQ